MINEFKLGRIAYPLGHLRGFRLDIAQKDPLLAPAKLQVTFSCHVFSEKWDGSQHSIERYFCDEGDERAFCSVRYGCSIGLEGHIRYYAEGKAYLSRDGNGVENPFFYAEANGVPYPVFFRLGRTNNIKGVDGVLHVISAYQNTKLAARHKYQSVKFARLVHQKCPPKPES